MTTSPAFRDSFETAFLCLIDGQGRRFHLDSKTTDFYSIDYNERCFEVSQGLVLIVV